MHGPPRDKVYAKYNNNAHTLSSWRGKVNTLSKDFPHFIGISKKNEII